MTGAPRYVLGLGGSSHDFSAAIVADWDILVGIEQERVTRKKHGAAFWFQHPVRKAVEYCLDATGLILEDMTEIVSSDLLPTRGMTMSDGRRVRVFGHHLCHAASAALMIPPEVSATILVADGMGSITREGGHDGTPNYRETFSFFDYQDGILTKLGATEGVSLFEHDDYPSGSANSVGKLYEVVTHCIGFGALQEGKTMGLAGFGEPRFAPMLREFCEMGDTFDTCFTCNPIEADLEVALEQILTRERNSFNCRADIAASVQTVFEEVLLNAQSLLPARARDTFMFAGGCALNTVCNARLAEALNGDAKFLAPPHAGDAGIGMGAAWLAQSEAIGGPRAMTVRGETAQIHMARLGRTYSNDDVRQAVNRYYPELALDEGRSHPTGIAELLSEGAVLGFFDGSAEFGPRALGGRSLLADPRSPKVRERINREIKFREPFRPLAPVIPEERFSEFFEPEECSDRFMMRVARARPDTARFAPSVVHVDGTARVQSVNCTASPLLHAILTAFAQITDVPILINTSFNRQGEPIVETPEDAITAYLAQGLDGIVLNGKVYFSP